MVIPSCPTQAAPSDPRVLGGARGPRHAWEYDPDCSHTRARHTRCGNAAPGQRYGSASNAACIAPLPAARHARVEGEGGWGERAIAAAWGNRGGRQPRGARCLRAAWMAYQTRIWNKNGNETG